jgi:hypothetical protein
MELYPAEPMNTSGVAPISAGFIMDGNDHTCDKRASCEKPTEVKRPNPIDKTILRMLLEIEKLQFIINNMLNENLIRKVCGNPKEID